MDSRIFDCFSTTNTPELCTSWGGTRARILSTTPFWVVASHGHHCHFHDSALPRGRRGRAEAPCLKRERLSDRNRNSQELCTCHDCPRPKSKNTIGKSQNPIGPTPKLQNYAFAGGVHDCPRPHFLKTPSVPPRKCRILH